MILKKGPIKDSFIGLRCDAETKKSLEDLAESLDMTVSHLIFRLIASGVNMEKQRREKIRQILAEV